MKKIRVWVPARQPGDEQLRPERLAKHLDPRVVPSGATHGPTERVARHVIQDHEDGTRSRGVVYEDVIRPGKVYELEAASNLEAINRLKDCLQLLAAGEPDREKNFRGWVRWEEARRAVREVSHG